MITIPSHPPTGPTCRTQGGLIKVERRWQQSWLPYQVTHQLVLPAEHITRLISPQKSENYIFLQRCSFLHQYSSGFGYVPIKKLFKSAIQCLKCYHFKVQTSQQLMVVLPHLRMQPSKPFTTTGADSAGPILQWPGKQHSQWLLCHICLLGHQSYLLCNYDKYHHWHIPSCIQTMYNTSRET